MDNHDHNYRSLYDQNNHNNSGNHPWMMTKTYDDYSMMQNYFLQYHLQQHQQQQVTNAMIHNGESLINNNFNDNNNYVPFVDNVGTIVFNSDDNIADVNMIDDDDYLDEEKCNDSFLKLDNQLNQNDGDNDEQEYWRNTRDCDYRLLISNNLSSSSIEQDLMQNITEVDKLIESSKTNSPISNNDNNNNRRKRKKCLSRKKRKKLQKISESIDLTKNVHSNHDELIEKHTNDHNELELIESNDDDPLDLNDIDINDIDKLNYDELISYYDKLKKEFESLSDENDNVVNANIELEFDHISSTDDDDYNDKNDEKESNSDSGKNDRKLDSPQSPLIENQVIETEEKIETKTSQNDSTSLLTKENSNKSTDWLLNEQILREKLIRSMMEKKNEPTSIIDKSDDNVKNSKPQIDLSAFKLVIELSSDEESNSDDDDERTQSSAILSTHSSKIAFNENNPSTSSSITSTINLPQVTNRSVIKTLSKNQQEEYENLCKEIERREKSKAKTLKTSSSSSSPKPIKTNEMIKKLKKQEHCYRQTLMNLEKKQKHLNSLKQKSFLMSKKLSQTKKCLDKLKKSYQLQTIQMKLFMKKMQKLQQTFLDNQTVLQKHHQACIRLGQQIYGQNYCIDGQNDGENRLKISNKITKKKKITNNKKSTAKNNNLFRNHIQLIVKNINQTPSLTSCILLSKHYLNFNFKLIRTTKFFQLYHGKIRFNDFMDIDSSSKPTSNELTICNYDPKDYHSVLYHFNSYRLMSNEHMLSIDHLNNLSATKPICQYDLMGKCSNQQCQNQHQKNYLLTNDEKLLNILSYSNEFQTFMNDQNDNEKISLKKLRKNPNLLFQKMKKFLTEKQMNFTDQKIEEFCRQLVQSIKSNEQIFISSLLIRSFPKELIKSSVENNEESDPLTSNKKIPFNDFYYCFDNNYRILSVELSNHQQNSIVDPDLLIQNRYFAPEGIPINVKLESLLSNEPNNIRLWMNLANYYMSKISKQNNFDHNLEYIESSLNVLSRALEMNKNCKELYEYYLSAWTNRSNLLIKQNKTNNDLIRQIVDENKQICRKILKNCSTFTLWIKYLDLCTKIEEKLSITIEILECFARKNMKNDEDIDEQQYSLNIIETIFYHIYLLLNMNQHQNAVKFFNDIFNPSSLDAATTTSNDNHNLSQLNKFIIPKHRSFAWHCYIYLLIYSHLPYHCFEFVADNKHQQQFISIIDTESIIFEWNNIIITNDNRQELYMIKKIFKRALRNCCSIISNDDNNNQNDDLKNCFCKNPIDSCLMLRLNLTNLNKILIKNISNHQDNEDDNLDNYLSFIFVNSQNNNGNNCGKNLFIDLQILHLFDIDLNAIIDNHNNNDPKLLSSIKMIELIYNFQRKSSNQNNDISSDLIENQLKFNYWIAFYYQRIGNNDKCLEILQKNLFYFIKIEDLESQQLDQSQLNKFYKILLFDKDEDNCDHIFSDQSVKIIRKNSSIYMYLSYMLLNHMNLKSSKNEHFDCLNSIHTTVINSFNLFNIESMKLFGFNYLLMLLDVNVKQCDSYFRILYENLRHLCFQFNANDSIFIYHLIITVGDHLIQPDDRSYFLQEFCRLIPTNISFIIHVFNELLQQKKFETLWKLLTFIVYEKRIRFRCLEFWKIAISLSIERNDHLNTHKLFQLSLKSMPYNLILWEMLKNYEKSIDHHEHLQQIQSYCLDSLGLYEKPKI